MFAYYLTKSEFWFRVFGYGVAGKNTEKHPLLFSERNGYVKTFYILGWSFRFLSK